MYRSVHIIGSKHSGGAERFFMRLVSGIARREPALAVCRTDSAIAEQLDPAVRRETLPMANVWDLLSKWRIGRLLKRHRPAVVQTYMGRATRLTRVGKARASVHVARLGGFYKLDGYRHADAWIGNTAAICDYLRDNGFPRDRVFHIRNFVESAPAVSEERLRDARRACGIPDEAWVVSALGRLVEKKGFADLVAAVGRLPESVADRPLHLVVAGDGPMRHALKRQADAAGVGGRIHWVGWQADPAPFYALGDVFVCPSRHEPLGNVILEAWSHGRPVLTTDTHGARELVTDGVDGIVAPRENGPVLAQRLVELLERPQWERAALGEAGRQVLLARYNADAVIEEYLDLYRRLSGG